MQTILRYVINASTVSARLWHCELCQPEDGTKCLFDSKTCSVSLVVIMMTSLCGGAVVNLRGLRGFHIMINFTKDVVHLCSRNTHFTYGDRWN